MNAPVLRRLPAPADLLLVLAVVALSTGVCALFEPYLESANLVLVYTAGVAFAAHRRGEAASILTVLASILVFDWIFVAPRWSLKPTDPQHYFTFAVMLAVGMLIGRLAERARQQTTLAETRARRAQALQRLTERLTFAKTREAVQAALQQQVADTLGLASTISWDDELRLMAAATPPPGTAIALAANGIGFGVFRIAGDGPAPASEQREMLEAFANQASLALERNLFESRSAEAALRAESERLRNTLLSAISHDFRTPLTTIVGATTSLLEQQDRLGPAARQALLQAVLQESVRLHEQMSDLLELTRLEGGALRPRPEWCPVDELVAAALGAVEARLSGHAVRSALPDELFGWGDAHLLQRALVNLLDNAARHTPPGTRVEVAAGCEAGQWWIEVRDDGPGLAPGSEQQAFQKFHHGAGGGAGSGTGLGLAICGAVARVHGGQVEARTSPGFAVRLTLPQPAGAPTGELTA